MMMVQSPSKSDFFRILVTDDDRSWRQSMREMLENRGYTTVEAESGEEAIDILHCQRVHLLMIDFQLPCMDGVETLRTIREDEHQECRQLPAILISSAVNESVLAQALALHAFTVMSKMMSMHRILYTVAKAMEKHYALNHPGGEPPDSTGDTGASGDSGDGYRDDPPR